jgi:membrane protein DedA with SNARE-associated domain
VEIELSHPWNQKRQRRAYVSKRHLDYRHYGSGRVFICRFVVGLAKYIYALRIRTISLRAGAGTITALGSSALDFEFGLEHFN